MLDPLELGTTFGEGMTPGKRQVRLFDLRGEHYEMGFQQGLQAREAIHHLFENLHQVEALQLEKPALVPFKVFQGMATRRAVGEMWSDINENCPNQRVRMEGIAKGADIDGSLLYLALAGELILAQTNYRLGACTAAAVDESRSALEEPMVIKNFDYPPFFQPHYIQPIAHSTILIDKNPQSQRIDCGNGHGRIARLMLPGQGESNSI